MFKNLSGTEIVVAAVIIFLIFGGKKIPEFFKSLGDAVREFKKASSEKGENKE